MIETKYITLTDESRNREIECKIYSPNPISHIPYPIIFSHGLGGSMDSYQYLGEALAQAGYFVIFPNHDGIDAKLLKEKRPFAAIKEAANDDINLMRPAQDVKFIIDWLEQKDEIDTSKIGLGGHSWGAFTTMQLCGQKHASNQAPLTTYDSRITAALAISPVAPSFEPELAMAEIQTPIFHITGTKDDSPIGLTTPEDRQTPFKIINNPNQYLVVFEGADHMVFAAQRRGNKFSELDLQILSSTANCATEFFRKYINPCPNPENPSRHPKNPPRHPELDSGSGEKNAEILNQVQNDGVFLVDTDEFYANLAAQNSNKRKS